MDPIRRDLTIWRGATFTVEYLAQNKLFIYNPAINVSLADRKRTHEENLEFYGFTYEYVNFLSLYTAAKLDVIKPWVRDGQSTEPILSLATGGAGIVLGSNKTTVTMLPTATKAVAFDSGSYNLLLTKESGQVDLLAYGTVTVRGDK